MLYKENPSPTPPLKGEGARVHLSLIIELIFIVPPPLRRGTGGGFGLDKLYGLSTFPPAGGDFNYFMGFLSQSLHGDCIWAKCQMHIQHISLRHCFLAFLFFCFLDLYYTKQNKKGRISLLMQNPPYNK